MPNTNAGNRRFRRNRASKKRNPKRPISGPGTTKRNPFSALLVTGIRSIVTALPGSTFLSPIVDLLLTSLGISNAKSGSDGRGFTVIDKIAFNGLSGMTCISYRNIMAHASNVARNTTKGSRLWFDTPYTDAKLHSVIITATPDSIIGKRSGRWALGFFPYRNVNDHAEMTQDYRPLTLRDLTSMAGTVTGPADRPLKLSFKPTPSDGYIFQYNSMDSYFGLLIITYSEDVRNNYHEFTAEDWAPNITIKGTMSLRQPFMSLGGAKGYEDIMFSLPSQPRAAIKMGAEDNYQTIFLTEKSFKCEKNGDYCKAVGSPISWVKPVTSLSDLSLEDH